MALIKCPECGKEISDTATTCPNCGYPLRVQPNNNFEESRQKTFNGGKKATVIGILGVVFGFVLGVANADQSLLVDAYNITHYDQMPQPIGTMLAELIVIIGAILVIIGIIVMIANRKKSNNVYR